MQSEIGKWIVIFGIGIVLIGLVIYFFGDRLHWIGRLPGDIRIERDNFHFYFPLTTMILASVLLTLLVRLVQWLFR